MCEHKWGKVALYIDGIPCIPCLQNGCDWGVRLLGENWVGVPGLFPMAVDGISLDIEDSPSSGVAKIVCMEIASSYGLTNLPLTGGDVVIDVGSHVGVVSIYLAKKYPGIRVYAFEPDARNFVMLERNIAANGVSVVPINLAITGDGRDIHMQDKYDDNTGGSSIYGDGDAVESVMLNTVFEEFAIERCALLKIDCEGAEYEILSPVVLSKIDRIRGEFHRDGRLSDAIIQATLNLCKAYVPDTQVSVIQV